MLAVGDRSLASRGSRHRELLADKKRARTAGFDPKVELGLASESSTISVTIFS